jgi:hypothetical protein
MDPGKCPSDMNLELVVFSVVLVLKFLTPACYAATVSCTALLLQDLYTAKGTLASCTHWARFLIEWNATLVNHAQVCVWLLSFRSNPFRANISRPG